MPAYKYQTKDGSKWYIKANYTDVNIPPFWSQVSGV